MQLKLHLGVHKTATTHFQKSLEASSSVLSQDGIKYIPLIQSRKYYSRLVKAAIRKRVSVAQAQNLFTQRINKLSQKHHTVLLSDENILGEYLPTLNQGVLYPDSTQYLNLIRKIFIDVELEIYLTVRSYDSFFSSFYSEAIRWEPCKHVDEYKTNFKKNADWNEFIKRITNTFEKTPKIFFFEDYVKKPTKQMSFFSNIPEEKFTVEKNNNLRSSMSHDAVNLITSLSPVIKRQPQYRRTVNIIEKTLPVTKQRGKFSPWKKPEEAELQNRYQAFRSLYH